MTLRPPQLFTSCLLVTNIHCPSCVSYAQDVLQHLSDIRQVDIALIDHTIRVQHSGDISSQIVQELIEAAFEVEHVTVTDSSGRQVQNYNVRHENVTLPPSLLRWPVLMSKTQRKHYENCIACREERKWAKMTKRSRKGVLGKRKLHDVPPDQDKSGSSMQADKASHKVTHTSIDGNDETADAEGLFVATFLIEGMTCASCVSSITKEVEQMSGVESVNVNLIANNAKIQYRGSKSKTDQIIESIEDIGFDAQLQHVDLVSSRTPRTAAYKAILSIEGMTCGSCVGTVTRGLQELQSVISVNVDLISNSAKVDFAGKEQIDTIIAKIEDMGYEATIASITEPNTSEPATSSDERTIDIQVAGMYCTKCPGIITSAIKKEFSGQVSIKRDLSTNDPHMTLVYTPVIPALTVRTFVHFINSLDPAYTASVSHAPSLEQRSRSIQRKERNRILRHLLLTFLVAIPTFVIGIVYMSLVSEHNPTRQWFQQPIWAGSVMRMDWALFIMTTPVMFYGANVFHIRALKEIWSLWRPKSRVPVLRRLYRFGSMNLLISAGTSVAYFSSLAVLVMEATTPRSVGDVNGMQQRSSTTYFDTVTFLTLFILCGRFLEAYSKAKTGDAVSMLSSLRPTDALLLENIGAGSQNFEKQILNRVSIDLLEVGDTVSVPHGTCPPMDGIIDQEGFFLFDESSLTGESRPVRKTQGDKVYTGSVNVSDPVRVKITEIGGKSMLDQIVSVVREGQAKRAPIERLADMLTGYFTPVITLLAITTWIIWLALGQSGALPQTWLDVEKGGWPFWSVEFAIAVFVVACPCGIGLAAPTALFVGGGLAAKHGILVQGGGEAFQEASRLDAIVLDKTGTLTEGKMRVTEMESLDNHSEKQDVQRILSLQLAKALEESSTHPIAKAIVDACATELKDQTVQPLISTNIQEIPGQGMVGDFQIKVDAETMTFKAAIGNHKLYKSISDTDRTEGSLELPELDEKLSSYQSSGHSVAIFHVHRTPNNTESKPLNMTIIFAITDPIRAEAPGIVSSLQSRGVSVHMCTGDNAKTAHAVAHQLGIPTSNIHADALPQDKAAYIKRLQYSASLSSTIDDSPSVEAQESRPHNKKNKSRKIIAFVGDGTNDTPALTVADISVAISHPSSSDIALTSASFILLNSNLASILTLVTLSRRVFLRVKMNFLWAGIYNIILIPVAAGVFFPLGANTNHGGWRLSPVWASAAMAASSVSVVLSSLALRLPELTLDRAKTLVGLNRQKISARNARATQSE